MSAAIGKLTVRGVFRLARDRRFFFSFFGLFSSVCAVEFSFSNLNKWSRTRNFTNQVISKNSKFAVLRARNLTAADSNGLSDPWCRLRLASGDTSFAKLQSSPKVGKTKVIHKVRAFFCELVTDSIFFSRPCIVP
jgi:hypothetical protein